ncbi:hypothetical protein D3C80_1670950 [compost metagenome]
MTICATTRHRRCAQAGRRATTMSVPMCPRSRITTTAPMNTIQTNIQRDSSSEMSRPVLKK